jgi:outer membrane protein assembly factor BamA
LPGIIRKLYLLPIVFVIAAVLCGDVAAAGGGAFASRMSAVDASREALEVEVSPFQGSIVDEIVVKGNTHTKRWTIIREMATKEGEHLDRDVLYRDHSYLRGLGFFSEVDITIDETSAGHCDVIVQVSERPDLFMKYPMPSLSYDLEKGVSYGIRWKIRNFQGSGQELFAGFDRRREQEQGASIAWSMPWVGKYRMRLSMQGFTHEKISVPDKADFVKERHGGGIIMGFPLTRSLLRQVWIMPDITLESRYSRLGVYGPPNQNGLYLRQLLLITGLSLTYDSRDNLISPFSGAFAGVSARRFTSVDGMKQQFSFMSLTGAYYLPVRGVGSLIFAFAGDNRDGELPWFYQLGMGGMNDLRGYAESDARGTSRLLTTIQLRRNVYGPNAFDIPLIGKFDLALNTVAFVDNGALMNSLDMAPQTRFHSTAGFGLEVISPIQDMVRFEVAFSEEGVPSYYVSTRSRF